MGLEASLDEGLPEYYVDAARITGNAFTISIEFGVQSIGPATDAPPTLRRIVLLHMSPQHAAALAQLLAQNVQKYEEATGQKLVIAPPEGSIQGDTTP